VDRREKADEEFDLFGEPTKKLHTSDTINLKLAETTTAPSYALLYTENMRRLLSSGLTIDSNKNYINPVSDTTSETTIQPRGSYALPKNIVEGLRRALLDTTTISSDFQIPYLDESNEFSDGGDFESESAESGTLLGIGGESGDEEYIIQNGNNIFTIATLQQNSPESYDSTKYSLKLVTSDEDVKFNLEYEGLIYESSCLLSSPEREDFREAKKNLVAN